VSEPVPPHAFNVGHGRNHHFIYEWVTSLDGKEVRRWRREVDVDVAVCAVQEALPSFRTMVQFNAPGNKPSENSRY